MIHGVDFDHQLITAANMGHFMNTFSGKRSGVTKGITLSYSGNAITVQSGYMLVSGRMTQITGTETVNVPEIASGTTYCRLVYTVDLSLINTESEFIQGYFEVLQNNDDYPTLTQQDLDDYPTDGKYQIPLAKFELTSSGIGSWVDERKLISVGETSSYKSNMHRWLRFNPNNRKGLIIKAGTSIKNSIGGYVEFATDTAIDLSSDISTNGADYFVYMSNDGTIHAYTTEQASGVKIGRFHTLCVNAGNMTMILPPSGNSVGTNVMVKSYREDEDADFYAFYRKPVTASSSNNETVAHPLSGFMAGDILPESVFCLSWHPNALVEDAMVYDKDTDSCVDVYLQSGKGLNTRSKYNATHTVSRQQANHMSDMRMVGKKLLSDSEFESASIGSNQATNITGSSDKGTVGGHVDTANRRMISAIGCEEMCGYLYQWTRDVSSTGGSSWATTDGNGSFGQEYGTPYVLLAGGYWHFGSYCGSRCRGSNLLRSSVNPAIGGRGLSRVVRGI